VTPTAVRQRLTRLMGRQLVDREAIRGRRGRPQHRYRLTERGLRTTGSNFDDLAKALWQEVRSIADPHQRRATLERVVRALVVGYAEQVRGDSLEERMESLRDLLAQRRVPFSVDNGDRLPTLTALACPYPTLADADRSVCAMERMLFSKLLEHDVELARCRLDGDTCCQFQTRPNGDILTGFGAKGSPAADHPTRTEPEGSGNGTALD
jgi:predicted ArsR family transcriptional regulator